MKFKIDVLCYVILSAFLLVSCATRYEEAQQIAAPSFLVERKIQTTPFTLTAYERVKHQNKPATIYIEGDGLAWINRYTMSPDPTPTNPVALRLAAADNSANVIYLARPCQYGQIAACSPQYWTDSRFAPEVMTSMNAALNDIKTRHNITEFNLVGFSGGAAIAVLLAAKRDDIVSLRSVAGNLDHERFTEFHNDSPLSGSLNPIDVARKINHIPQHHFIGAEDETIPSAIAENFIKHSGKTNCIRSSIVPDTTHEDGWADIWPALLARPLDCDIFTAPTR